MENLERFRVQGCRLSPFAQTCACFLKRCWPYGVPHDILKRISCLISCAGEIQTSRAHCVPVSDSAQVTALAQFLIENSDLLGENIANLLDTDEGT